MRRRSRKSRDVVALWLGVFALALHGMIPLAQGLPGPERTSGLPSSLILCIAFAAKAEPAEDSRTPTAGDHRSCPICQINALGKSLLSTMAAASPPPDWSAEWPERASVYACGSPLRSWQARAPPTVA